MKYICTRNKNIFMTSSEAIINGISKDGGLFIPEDIPKINNLNDLKDKNYKELAFHIMDEFFTDYEDEVLKRCIDKAYDDKFDVETKTPTIKVGNEFILELFHGPTLAFKDMALSILPYLLKEATRINHMDKEIVILTATSGDTGKAALEGFADVEGMKIIVFYPEDGVSNIQKLQMTTQKGDNTFVVGINGNFDDAQNGVKDILGDKDFNNLLEKNNYILSSANSINIGRLIPQIVYYFQGYLSLLNDGQILENEKINIVVPTGNFGNILAAYYSKKMGLPINKLICASNENNVLTEFFNTGVYDSRRDLILSSSPSMDILISSNLERLLFHLSQEDDKLIRDKMHNLKNDGFYKFNSSTLEDFYGGYSTEKEVEDIIRKVFKEHEYILDPHTAVAYSVYEKYKIEAQDYTKTIIASTASPFKFPLKVATSIGLDAVNKDDFEVIQDLGQYIKIPKSIIELQDKKGIHNNNCNKEDMKKYVKNFLEVGVGYD